MAKQKEWVIYVVTNTLNGKRYWGKTMYGIAHRWREHIKAALAGDNSPLHRAMRKYGVENFTIEAKLILKGSFANQEELDAMEIGVIARSGTFGKGYNATRGGEGFTGTLSAETRAILSARHKGMRASAETREKMRLAHLGNKSMSGRRHTPEARAKMSASRKGKPLQEPRKPRRPVSAETRAKMSAARKGNKYRLGSKLSAETRAKLSAARKGKPHPWARKKAALETRAKMTASHTARWARLHLIQAGLLCAWPRPAVSKPVQQSLF